MPTPKQILSAFAKVRAEAYGARYHKVDFHVHTPASTDARGKNKYGFNPYKEALCRSRSEADPAWAYEDRVRAAQAAILTDARALAERMLDRFVAEKLRVVAITDHNALGTVWPVASGKTMDLAAPTWYELLDEAAEHRRAQGLDSCVILPGTEVSTAGVHILGVFPPTPHRREAHLIISSLLVEVGVPIESFGHNPQIGHAGPRDTVDAIHRRGGIAIIAHVDARDKALFRLHPLGSSELKVVLAHPQLHALEMVEPKRLAESDPKLAKGASLGQWIAAAREDAKLDGLAYFQGSDAHDLGRIGARWSYVMMSTPSFAGLHDALISPSSRVRLGDMVDAPPKRAVYIYGFELNHPIFGTVRARLNRNLNCIIGGPDTGKSTLLAALERSVSEASEGEGRAMLLMELHDEGGTPRRFCFSRRRDAVELHELVTGPGADALVELPPEDPLHQDLRPRFYDRARMRELIGSALAIQDFMRRYFGAPNPANVAKFNRQFDLPDFLSATASPLLEVGLDDAGGYALAINLGWRQRGAKGRIRLQPFARCSASLQRLIILMMVLVSARSGPVIIDEPADEFDNADISRYLVPLVKLLKGRAQVLLATRNANLAVNADPENYVMLEREPGTKAKTTLESGFAIDDEARREAIINLLEGDLAAFERRRALYSPART